MRVIIAGSRGLPESEAIVNRIEEHLEKLGWHGNIEAVVSGKARGGDGAGELYAKRHGIAIIEMPAEWKTLGKAAGYRRNERMAKVGTHLLAIWDGVSKGTKHMIDIAKAAGLEVAVRRFTPPPKMKKPGPKRRKGSRSK